ncbi:hypothetical protein UlMin_015791 [Ulmus minor]
MGDSDRFSRTLDDSKAVELTGKIMVVAIIMFFVVIVFVIFIHLYGKWFWWRIEESPESGNQSRRRRRRFVFAPGQDPTVATLRRGLDPTVLRSLPVLVYRPEDFKEGLECAVCLSELVADEKARLLPKCNHGFHVDCIDMWFQSHSTCPLCRDSVGLESSSASTGSSMAESLGEDNLGSGFSSETPSFPTNILFWGNQMQVSSGNSGLEEGPSQTNVPTSSSSASSRVGGVLVIDIPNENPSSSSLSPSASRLVEDDLKSPVTTRLRSLKRLLSREKRASPLSPSSVDVEQGGRAQS